MDIQKILSYETARKYIYRSLANCFQSPDEKIQTEFDTLAKQLSIIESEALQYVQLLQKEVEKGLDHEFLKIEFTRLFVGPYSLPAPPYGSVYIDHERKVMGDSTMDAKNRYQSFGLDISNNIKEVPDHITVELEFMFFLIFKEIESIQSDASDKTQEILLHQKAFLNDHLNRWVPDFTDCVIEHAGTEFYRNLAKATRIFIAEEVETLESISVSVTQD
jgi:TorA maturation chaperone TorD